MVRIELLVIWGPMLAAFFYLLGYYVGVLDEGESGKEQANRG